VVEAAVVLVLEAHAEQDHDEGTSPSESSVLKRTFNILSLFRWFNLGIKL
jgi:hypothetical protein